VVAGGTGPDPGRRPVSTRARVVRAVYVRLADPRCRTNAIWLDASDVKRINRCLPGSV
jgi:hypothetical protein